MSGDHYYKVGGSLEYQHPTYVVRKADYELYEGLTNGEFCYVLNSRQMGKSSLRVQMMKKLKEQGCKCASIDMTRIGSHVTPSEWYAGVVSELLRGFGLTRKINFSTWWRDREALPPLQRLRELIEDVLLVEFSQNIVIFIDEIDSIIKIKFKEDFFAFIRACYNHRVDNSEYNRLTFCLLGVATPSDLIEDKNISTPFNIGRAIELTGFQLDEVQPLLQGLAGKVSHPLVVIQEVLKWTGGQPFLTQKLCKLILAWEQSIPESREAQKIEELVQSHILENWETQDEPEHLRTIRDRILWSQRKELLLRLYLQILQKGEVKSPDKPEHMELRLSGLVVKQRGKLKVYNRIYASVFNQSWVEHTLAEAGLVAEAVERLTPSQAAIQTIEQAVFDALQQFESKQIESLISAMEAGQALKALVGDGCPLQDYPTVSLLYTLQTILDNIRERNCFNAHQSGVNSVSFSPDGQYLVTGGEDGTIALWNLYGQQIVKWRSHLTPVLSVSFSPDGQHIASSGLSGNIRLWDLSGQHLTQMHCYQRAVWSISFSPDGKHLATVGEDGTVKVWKLLEQQLAQQDTHHGEGMSVRLSGDGQYLATVGENARIRLYLSRQQLAEWKDHQDWVTDISFSPNGKQIATVSRHGKSNLWHLSIQQLAHFNHFHYQPSVRRVSFSLDMQSLATATRVWNLSGQPLAQLKGHQDSFRSMSCSPNGQYLATAGSDGTVRLWDLSEKHLAQWHSNSLTVRSVSFSPDGQSLATAGADSTVRLWNLQGKQLAQLDGHEGRVRRVSFSTDGQRLVTVGDDSAVRLWNLQGQQIVLNGHRGRVNSVSFSPDNLRLATAGDDGTVRLWNLQGKQLDQLSNHLCRVNVVSFSPDGQYLATAGADGKVRLWNLEGELLLKFKSHRSWVYSMSFSPNGHCLATGGGADGTVRLWNLSGYELAQWQSHRGTVYCISFHPNGQQIATAGEDSKAILWDLSGRQLAQWQSPRNSVYSTVSFSPDGRYLATAGTGGLQIWRIRGLDELLASGCDWLRDYCVTHPEAQEKLEGRHNKKKSSFDEEILSDRTATLEGQTTLLTHPNQVQTIQPQIPSELPATLEPEPNAEINSVEADKNLAEVGEVEGALADIQKSAQTSNSTSKRILWVDDNPTNIAAELTQLNEKGIEVIEVHSINQAIEMLVSRGLSFDAIISDMARTENGEHRHNAGILLIQAVREAGFTLPIFIYSSMAGDRMSKAVVTAGGNGATRSVEALFAWLREYTNLAELVNVKGTASPSSASTAVICDRSPSTVAQQGLAPIISKKSGDGFLGEFLVYDKLVKIYQGDITNLVTDVIVSSDDNYLIMGGGVSRRIRQVGGDEIFLEARKLTPLSLGEVAVTTAGNLRAKKIFHAVVIDFDDREEPSNKVIQRVVHTCMKKANCYKFSSIAFPLLGTGAVGFPVRESWETLLNQIIRDLSELDSSIDQVFIALYERKVVEELKIKLFLEAIEKFGWKSVL
ncbi:MAG: AAA-like domain-containing protein [Cyanobacteriota bacterium]